MRAIAARDGAIDARGGDAGDGIITTPTPSRTRTRVLDAFDSSLPTSTGGADAGCAAASVMDIARGVRCALARASADAQRAVEASASSALEACARAESMYEAIARAQCADAREIARLTECVREQAREIDALRERVGRDIIRRSSGGEVEVETFEKTRAECELWREACGKFRKRAEHYERLYKASVAGSSGQGAVGATVVVRETQVSPTTTSAGARKRAPDAGRRGGEFKRAMRGESSGVVKRDRVGVNDDDDGDAHAKVTAVMAHESAVRLWGGPIPTAAARGRVATPPPGPGPVVVGDSENPTHGLRDDIELGRREHAPPLNRIFLDANASGGGDAETSNRVRKSKRLSDNAPTPANEVFERAPPKAISNDNHGGATAAAAAGKKQVKYVEVVRKKSERERLDAYVCEECRTFYNAMMPEKQPATIKCTHEPPSNANNSRHRAKWAPEPAPKGFWNLAFTPPEAAGE